MFVAKPKILLGLMQVSDTSSRKKHALFNRWKKTRKTDAHLKYKAARNAFSNQFKFAKQTFFVSLLNKDSPSKSFWGCVKSRSGQSSIPDTINYKGTCAFMPLEIANSFSQFFSECFNCDVTSIFSAPHYNITSSLSHFRCSSDEIWKLICKLNNTLAAGVDGITAVMLKNTAVSVSPILCKIFNLSISTGSTSSAWKLSRVIPIYKSGDRHSVSNYRPISLQPIVGKTLERVIHKHMLSHLNDQQCSDRPPVWFSTQVFHI